MVLELNYLTLGLALLGAGFVYLIFYDTRLATDIVVRTFTVIGQVVFVIFKAISAIISAAWNFIGRLK